MWAVSPFTVRLWCTQGLQSVKVEGLLWVAPASGPTASVTSPALVAGGIAGGALATVLAGGGFDIVVLERQAAYR